MYVYDNILSFSILTQCASILTFGVPVYINTQLDLVLCTVPTLNVNTVDPPPIPPLSGLAKKQRYWKTAVLENGGKGSQISDFSSGIGGRRSTEGRYLGDCNIIILL